MHQILRLLQTYQDHAAVYFPEIPISFSYIDSFHGPLLRMQWGRHQTCGDLYGGVCLSNVGRTFSTHHETLAFLAWKERLHTWERGALKAQILDAWGIPTWLRQTLNWYMSWNGSVMSIPRSLSRSCRSHLPTSTAHAFLETIDALGRVPYFSSDQAPKDGAIWRVLRDDRLLMQILAPMDTHDFSPYLAAFGDLYHVLENEPFGHVRVVFDQPLMRSLS